MEGKTRGQTLQQAYRECVAPYAEHLQIAVTFTLKQRAKIRVRRFENYGDDYYEYWHALTEETLNSTIRYFTALLTDALYGNASKHKNKRAWARPLVIVAVEGRNTAKRTHLHLAIGNIPAEKLGAIEDLILAAWRRCDFGYKKNEVKPLSNSYGWLTYMTKQVGYTDNDAVDIVSSSIPSVLVKSVCTEGRSLSA